MRLAIVHLSDLHIKANNPLLTRPNAIANAIPSICSEPLEIILAWTGDIAFSGEPGEYSLATDLVESVESALKANARIRFLGSTFIPGNHDCDFTLAGDARLPLIESLPSHIDQLHPSGDMVQQISRPEENFFSFLTSRGKTTQNRLIWEYSFDSEVGNVLVRCCNTAWMSQLPEKPLLLFPPHAIKESQAPLTISLLHHPFSWFEPINGKAVRRKLEIDSDLILTGHEHDPDSFSRAGSDSSTRYLEASALAAANVQTGFTVSLVDRKTSEIQMFAFDWSEPLYVRSIELTVPFVRKQRAIVNRFVRSQEFEKKLEELTTPFTHPRKELRLSDIYVPPPLTHLIPAADGRTSESAIASEGVLDFLLNERLVRISAPTGYGKSSLARVLCRDFLDLRSIVPVFLDPDLVSGYEADKVSSSIERAFVKQYGENPLEHFRQLPRTSKVIVFDDWDRLRFNENGRRQLLAKLVAHADYVILFDDVSALFQQINDLALDESVPRPKLCELRQFGYQLRGALIDRWHRLGRAFEVSEGTLAHDVSVSEHLLNALVGRGIMPSSPLFVLSGLQMQQEANKTAGDYGSYGHIYQGLITSRLSRKASKLTPLKVNFLALLALRMFEDQSDSLNLAQIKEVASNYEEQYAYDIAPDSLLREIAESGLVQFDGDTFKFEYRYVYYYSVAFAFKTNVANEETREGAHAHLKRLAKEAYFDDNANILIFYIYLSKDRVLIEEVLSNARNIFVDETPCDLESDVEFVNKLFQSPPDLPEPSEDISTNIAEYRAARDEAVKPESALTPQKQAEKEFSEVDFALRSLEIMGQVLKNFPTDLRRDQKVSLTKESYALGLRSMGSFLKMLQNNREKYREATTKHLAKETAFAQKSIKKQQETLDEIVIFFAEVGIFGILKTVSSSLGSEELRNTYDEVRSELGESQVATRLIDLSIRLDHFGTIPEHDVFQLEKRLKKNVTAWTILSMLIGQRIALFPTHWKLRQKLVQTFKLQRALGRTSSKQLLPGD